MIELCGRLVVQGRPGLPAVERDSSAAVVSLDHALGVARIDPQDVAVAVRHANARKRPAPVDRSPRAEVQGVDRILVRRVGGDEREVPRANHEPLVGVDPLPALARVVGAENPARRVRRFHAGPQSRRVGGRHGDADATQRAGRQAVTPGDIGPGVSAVGALPEPAPAASGGEAPGEALILPQRGVQDACVGRIEREIDRAGGIVDEQHLRPALAPVARAEHAACGVRSERVPHGGDVDDVRVGRVDADHGNVARIVESEVAPRLAAVGRSPHPIAVCQVFPPIRLARAHVDHIGVGRGHRDRAYRRDVGRAVAHVAPRLAAVGRLPHTAIHGSEVEGQRVNRVARHRHHATAAERADEPPVECAQGGVGRGGGQRADRIRMHGAPFGLLRGQRYG